MEKSSNEFSLNDTDLLNNLSVKIRNIYNGIDCENCTKSFCSSCLNSIRQALEYLCLFTCNYYKIKLTKRSKSGELIENESPTLGDMAPLIESYFKENGLQWSKEIDTHIGTIWILGNLGSHAQKDMINNNTEINRETIINAKNSMYVVTKWFYNHFNVACPIIAPSTNSLPIKKTNLTAKAEELLEKIKLIEQNRGDFLFEEQKSTENEFSDVYWDDLIEAIGAGSCVLFLGHDIFMNEAGESLHQKFFTDIEGKNIKYNPTDGFFMPGSEKQLKIKAMNFFGKDFLAANTTGNLILKKISQIPLNLVISVTPDDSIHRIWSSFNKSHEFLFYNGQKQESFEPTKESPIIYNLLGNATLNGNYILTHEQFYVYLNEKREVKIPIEIENKVKDAFHYLFLGIDFNKWHNRLLLFCLNLNGEGYSLNNQNVEDINQDFVLQQFKVSSITTDYMKFVDILIEKCREKGFYKPLIQTFIENTTVALDNIAKGSVNEESYVLLDEIEFKITSILEEFKSQL